MIENSPRYEKPNKTLKSQAYFWTQEWQEAERQADEDIRAGRVKRFMTVEELIKDSDKED